MKKNASKGKLTVPIMVILTIFAILVYLAVSKGSSAVPANSNKLYEEVMAFDFSREYPQSPDNVLEKYTEIDRFLSGNTIDGFTNSELENLVEKQRMLLHPELLEINSFEEQVKGYADKIDMLKESGMRLMQVNRETPRFSDDAKLCSIGVTQYWTEHTSVNLVYNLKKEDAGNWKIIGWFINEQIEEQ